MSFDRLTKLLLVEINEVTSVAIVGDPTSIMIPVSATTLVDALEAAVIGRCRRGSVSPVAVVDRGDVETLREFVVRSVSDFEDWKAAHPIIKKGVEASDLVIASDTDDLGE